MGAVNARDYIEITILIIRYLTVLVSLVFRIFFTMQLKSFNRVPLISLGRDPWHSATDLQLLPTLTHSISRQVVIKIISLRVHLIYAALWCSCKYSLNILPKCWTVNETATASHCLLNRKRKILQFSFHVMVIEYLLSKADAAPIRVMA